MKIFGLILIGLFIVNFSYSQVNLKTTHSDSIDVLNYSINLDITDIPGKRISGYTDLEIVPKVNNLNSIPLDLLHLNVDSIFINDTNIISYSYNDTLLRTYCLNPYSTNDTIILKIYYNGQPVIDPSTWGGFYFGSGYAFNLGVGFEDNPHNYGRVWYPCIDDFVDRATYNCNITVDSIYEAVCGGVLDSAINNMDGTKTYYWYLKQEIPTYLSSVAVNNYICVNDTFNSVTGSIPIDLYVYPGDSSNAAGTFANLKEMLTGFEDRFGPYLWDRVGYVAVPFNSGAMEHATNIAFPRVCINGAVTAGKNKLSPI